jgi:CDP-diacylglycerol--glycerol-3-phosphate 3-phosphatidyltransferase
VEQKRFLTLPNALTLFRMASAPLFLVLWFGLTGDSRTVGVWACLVVAFSSEMSDLLDGWLARRTGQVSNFGKLMDPYADSIFRLTAFLSFAAPLDGDRGWYPLWMPILLVLRDIGTSIVRTFSMEQGTIVAAKASGKIKAVAQGFLLVALLVLAVVRGRVGMTEERFLHDVKIMMAVVIAVAYWSLADYLWRHISVFRKSAAGSD